MLRIFVTNLFRVFFSHIPLKYNLKIVLLPTRPTAIPLVSYLAFGSLFCYLPVVWLPIWPLTFCLVTTCCLVTYLALDILFGYQPSIWLQKPCHFVCLPTRPLTFCLVTYLILGTLFGYLPARLYFVWLPN